jgi:hypothetical protein
VAEPTELVVHLVQNVLLRPVPMAVADLGHPGHEVEVRLADLPGVLRVERDVLVARRRPAVVLDGALDPPVQPVEGVHLAHQSLHPARGPRLQNVQLSIHVDITSPGIDVGDNGGASPSTRVTGGCPDWSFDTWIMT